MAPPVEADRLRRAQAAGAARPLQGRCSRSFIVALAEASKDITLTEIGERLANERGVKTSRALVWFFFDKRGATFK